jgi:hypothetical protein
MRQFRDGEQNLVAYSTNAPRNRQPQNRQTQPHWEGLATPLLFRFMEFP